MSILTDDLDKEEAELKAKQEYIDRRRQYLAAEWGFVEEAFVDPTPYQNGLPAHISKGASVIWYSKRAIGISVEVRTWEDAIAYALQYEKKASAMSKVKCGSCSFLPATILDYGYEKPDQTVERTVGGIAVATISGGRGFHTEELELCLVQNADPLSRWCQIHIRIINAIYTQYCRFGERVFNGPLPPCRVTVSYGSNEPIRHTGHGELMSGGYNKVCLLDDDANLDKWLPTMTRNHNMR